MLRLLILLLTGALARAAFIPDFKLKPDDYTVLMAVDASLSDGLVPFQPGGHGKFHVERWQRPDQQALWNITAPGSADHAVQVLVRQDGNQQLRLEVSAAGTTLSGTLPADARRWQRIALPGTLALPAGESTLTLRLSPADGSGSFNAAVHAIELVRPAVRDSLRRKALALRADPGWFQQARFGVMVHWTSQSMPLTGDPKPYDQAVAAFDVEAFADRMRQTGAGFVVFTTSHAHQYFPAPLAALDRILPGRNAKRDLVADLAAALGRRGMKLMLYFHPGAADDPAWLAASGFWETDTTRYFANWQAVIREAGERYGERLAGWWFDDGSTNYYYRSAPWEDLARAAKAGHPGRLTGFNAWELNNPTEFHDFFTGEGFQDPRGYNELLVPGGDGRYPSGTHRGLQASACLVFEGDWLHRHRDRPLNPPKWNAGPLTDLLQGFIGHKSVPIFNLEISQEGTVSPLSVERLGQAAAAVRAAALPIEK
jgi:hypothetical protein